MPANLPRRAAEPRAHGHPAGLSMPPRARRRAARPLLGVLHLWLGIVLGLPFAVLGLTGSALVFYIELDRLLNPEVAPASLAPAPGWTSPEWDAALATARATLPDAPGRWSFEATGEPGAIPARYYPPDEGPHADPLMVWFSPDGTRLLRRAQWGDYAMTFLYDVHRNLLAGETGNRMVGWLGFATAALLVSGVVAWWPRGSWGKAVALRRRAPPVRRLRDWHKLTGLASAGALLVLAGTGALLALPPQKEWLLARLAAPMKPVPAPRSVRGAGRQVPVATALAAAHAALPGARLAWIDVPGPGDGAFRIRAQVPGDPTYRFAHSYVFVDQYSGAVLAVHDLRALTAGNTANSWIRPLHDGSAGGAGTRILGVIAGLAPLALFVTGVLRWRVRRRARAATHSGPGL